MQPRYWKPPVELTSPEKAIVKRIKRAKLFVFLREHRHEVFTEAFQEELAQVYQASARGQPPIPPAQLALATILQAYTGASDDEVRDREHHGSTVAVSVRLSGHRGNALESKGRWWPFASG